MYRDQPYTGSDLPSKSICLTYDDGPGEHTYDIAKFLYDQNIRATFFVVGKYAFHHQDILEKLSEMGHLIGNHTYEHPDMPYYLSKNGDIQNQILRTDAIIKKYITQGTVYFRSPYGKWSEEVANEMNLNILTTANHLGPIHWDIAGVDCYCWQKGFTVEDAVKKYMDDIKEKDHGIVVMHDNVGDMEYLKEKNSTLELTKQLIPLLRLQGYKFVRLDEIPSIKKDVSALFTFSLKAAKAGFVSIEGNESNTVTVDGNKNNILNQLSLQDRGASKIAIRGSNGLYFSLREDKGNVIESSSPEIGKHEEFDLVPLSSNRLILRGYNGNYLIGEKGNSARLVAAAPYMRGAELFSFFPPGIATTRKASIGERYKSLKRQAMYIRSKIQQGIP